MRKEDRNTEAQWTRKKRADERPKVARPTLKTYMPAQDTGVWGRVLIQFCFASSGSYLEEKTGNTSRDSPQKPLQGQGIIYRTEEKDVSRQRDSRGDEVWKNLRPRQSVALVVSRGAGITQSVIGHSETGLNDSKRQVNHLLQRSTFEGPSSHERPRSKERDPGSTPPGGQKSDQGSLADRVCEAFCSRLPMTFPQKETQHCPVSWTLAPIWPHRLRPRTPSTQNGAFILHPEP